jgi:3-(3-hydroxy-phenyl)propionate hydroxylase
MTPFTYAESPAVLRDDPGFAGGPGVGAAMPDARVEGGFLSDRLGAGFALVCFDQDLAAAVRALPDAPEVVCLAPGSEPASVLAAGPGSAYLVRPDRHVAARWTDAAAAAVADALPRVTFRPATVEA